MGSVGGLVWGHSVSAVLLLIRTGNWSGSPDISSDLDPRDYAVACCCLQGVVMVGILLGIEVYYLHAGCSETVCKGIGASRLEELGALLSPTMATITHI